MSSLTFFFIFIILYYILLVINFLFSPHNPYQEKDSAFECGFHLFLGQNRTQFSISLFIFALFLSCLEIIYNNSIYGLAIMLIFLLTLEIVILIYFIVFFLNKNHYIKYINKQKKPNKFKDFIKKIFKRIFNKHNRISSIIICITGFFVRSFIIYAFDIDIFKNHLHPISFAYYGFMAIISPIIRHIIKLLLEDDDLNNKK